jgi:hypothetical protein
MDCESVESSEKGVHSGTGKSPEKMQNGRLCNSRSKKSPEKMQNGKLCNSRSIESPEKMQDGRLCNSRSKKSPEKMQNGRLCIPRAWNLQRRLQNSRCAFQGVEISGEDAEFVSCIFMFTHWTLLVDRTSIIVANFITHSHKGSPYHHEFLGASCHHQLLNFVILQ